MEDLLTLIFVVCSDFCKSYKEEIFKFLLPARQRNRDSNITLEEIMSIEIFFHYSGYKNFKVYYYNFGLKEHFLNNNEKTIYIYQGEVFA